jgi:hypothetical protein
VDPFNPWRMCANILCVPVNRLVIAAIIELYFSHRTEH